MRLKDSITTAKKRDTSSGIRFEKEIVSYLEESGKYKVETQVCIGSKRNGGIHRVDVILDDRNLISLKHQGVPGTAEEKINHEFMKLQHAIDDFEYDSATIVIDDPNGKWKWRDYYLSDDFKCHMRVLYPDVNIMDTEKFSEIYNFTLSEESRARISGK